MSDKELAKFLAMLLSQHRKSIIEQLHRQGIIQDVEISETPVFCKEGHPCTAKS